MMGWKSTIIDKLEELWEQLNRKEHDPVQANGVQRAIDVIAGLEESEWIPVTERLPENEKVVLICAERKSEKKVYTVISTAFYTDGTMWEDDSVYSWNDMDDYYDTIADDYLIPEGWWEDTNYGEEFCAVDDFVRAWMPLPEPYIPET